MNPESTNAQVVNTQFGLLLVAEIDDETRSIPLPKLAERLTELAAGQRRGPQDEIVLKLASELVHATIVTVDRS